MQNKKFKGLGIKNIVHQNLCVFFKWLWRVKSESNDLWQKIVQEKYKFGNSLIPKLKIDKKFSHVWQDIGALSLIQPFARGVKLVVGNGSLCKFWFNSWILVMPLKDLFLRLHTLAYDPQCLICDCGVWSGSIWSWNFTWRRNLRIREEAMVKDLINLISSFSISHNKVDKKVWIHSSIELFFV